MIILSKEERKNVGALTERREYVQSLLAEGRPNVSPSSQDWISSERYEGFTLRLRNEMKEIDTQLQKLQATKTAKVRQK